MSLALLCRPWCDIDIMSMRTPGVDPDIVESVHEIHRMVAIHYLPNNVVDLQCWQLTVFI